MSAPNRSTLWGRVLVEELVAGGLDAVCVAPGSRSTPLTVAFAAHPDVTVYSHLDERSTAYFALGRARRTGEPTAVVCTSGTALANIHPAVVEADRGRVPLLVLTADRPAELRDSGANQTIDQREFYGDAVRWSVDLPEPDVADRRVRSLRTTAARALVETGGTHSGPVHLNCPFSKPLEPTEVASDPGADADDPAGSGDPDRSIHAVPDDFDDRPAGRGRDGPFVSTADGETRATDAAREDLLAALESADRPLVVVGPADPSMHASDADWREQLVGVADSIGAPILADPLSDLRYGPWADSPVICTAYDGYVADVAFDPDVVIRFGAAPTSKRLAHALRDASCRQFLVDAAGGWREATFTATDLLVADPVHLIDSLSDDLAAGSGAGNEPAATADWTQTAWLDRFRRAETAAASVVEAATEPDRLDTTPFEGAIARTVLQGAPPDSTVFVSNSMPIRDADRFGGSRGTRLHVLGNRGASGIDGIVSAALGAGSVDDEHLTLLTGDLALYHDSNGLLAVERCEVDVTIVAVHNDGGGIFHMLPIEDHDPPFTDHFKTPHGLDFEPLADMYGLSYASVDPADVAASYRRAVESDGSHLLSVSIDGESSHRRREALAERVRERLRTDD
ncbi:2-succinyl-5-enolpyruvyl-6-hydroxy-3-cyclohexene-1-carboxylic-acid synthase [Halovivax limisalsi]|uniref:2-succinyl-5-enolpyruvyl-6-hydroxy-3- cyclohexene-1-carboxylic-acid synthase n=1 Tax=Halovivax limisalsi TaxID=1453760 RepID=UPI001FFD8811|nr:2-succinyl-5-enolpyruvyl-6-hydroxy-3-cyclohexene-1-carboxylic-acid synthase [Halovivax limisalsi]